MVFIQWQTAIGCFVKEPNLSGVRVYKNKVTTLEAVKEEVESTKSLLASKYSEYNNALTNNASGDQSNYTYLFLQTCFSALANGLPQKQLIFLCDHSAFP
jgi:hypothetical protein